MRMPDNTPAVSHNSYDLKMMRVILILEDFHNHRLKTIVSLIWSYRNV